MHSVATCYWQLGNNAKADEYFNNTVNIKNITPWILAQTYAIKAHRLYENENCKEALEYYKKAIELADSEQNKRDWQIYADFCEEKINEAKA